MNIQELQKQIIGVNMKADEMFEKLGYSKLDDKEIENEYLKIYDLIECAYKGDLSVYITFYKNKTFTNVTEITMEELQAINKKCKELGWLEE